MSSFVPRPCAIVFLLGNIANAIDSTQGHMHAPHEREWEHVGRKGKCSGNIHLAGDDGGLIITNCVVRWPGSVHDASILREVALHTELPTNRPDAIVLGDSAYPLLPWRFTSFLTPEQARSNTAHRTTRCAIEGRNVLKRRFAWHNYVSGTTGSAQLNTSLCCPAQHRYQAPSPSLWPAFMMHLRLLKTLKGCNGQKLLLTGSSLMIALL